VPLILFDSINWSNGWRNASKSVRVTNLYNAQTTYFDGSDVSDIFDIVGIDDIVTTLRIGA